MKILLASDGSFLIKYGYNIIGIPKDQIRIGYVITASQIQRIQNIIHLHGERFKSIKNHASLIIDDCNQSQLSEIFQIIQSFA